MYKSLNNYKNKNKMIIINSKVGSLAKIIIAVFALASLTISFNASALGQLMVSPTRVVFEGNDRTKQVSVINNGSETGRFRISFVRRNMNADGNIKEADKDEIGMYSDEMIRFSPRQVTLEPGQSQTVRLLLRKKSGTVDGEYRSHMMFQSLPDAATSDVSKLTSNNSDKFTVTLIPVVGITIPVIVRQGKLDSDVTLSDFEIKQGNTVKAQSVLSLKINRVGNRSAYGDFRVYFTPKNGTPITIGRINGVAVYTSTNSRTLDIKLQLPEKLNLANGELRVTYLVPGRDEKSGLIAESRLATP
ncbi:MAG: molecular chaperone [Gammaproteobacteria bacterium]|nr:MAG: molecular chaperone [Gammaproteobacteria bacterium]